MKEKQKEKEEEWKESEVKSFIHLLASMKRSLPQFDGVVVCFLLSENRNKVGIVFTNTTTINFDIILYGF